MSAATILLIIMWIFAAVFFVVLVRDVLAHKDELDKTKMGYNSLISLIANFFDTLGIGSYAIATSAWKFNKSVRDDLIPGTLNVAFGIPICVEATITMTRIEMDSLTLVLMIAAAIIGSILGAKIISRLDVMKIRVVMGVALIIVAAITLCKINAVGPFGILGTARGLEGGMLVVGVIANFILGILMTAGIGLYAPCMAIVLLLGMSADVAFPVMMGSCAYLCPACGITFIKEGKYNRASTIPMIFTGAIGVLIAGFIVTSLPLTVLTYLVCVVMVICAIMFFNDARRQKN
ncbi:sulfite exporter TauE/SafE family protein [Lachnospiraceae bacterium DSM 108991]|uniref:Sulfite exporter TauE/SafE family protein n=1 Tax=Claveliimonas monacensis TaxID=2779351 RepID=A0ABR9RGR6_9FIRM|nr:sulfite exporter TauE/SafE family protein [Claveliimonas monacensis]MBE5062167.1 sulfite exporter TauE/SafE family protein [Claveliimonas monacensis]